MKFRLSTCLLSISLGLGAAFAHAQSGDLLPPASQVVAAVGAPAPTHETFTVAAVQDLVVTLTDLLTPAALSGAQLLVTQGSAMVGMSVLAPPATSAALNLPGAVGQYSLYVIGTPNPAFNVGTFNVCVAPKATPAACIADASLSGNITVQSSALNPTVSTLSTSLTVTAVGAYTVTYSDEQFPAALVSDSLSLALFQGSTLIAAPLPASPATLSLSPGVYTLFAIAQADPTAEAGLYGITVVGPGGAAPLLNSAFPVGTLAPASQRNNPSAQNLTLSVTDFAFPTALGAAKALVTNGATMLGSATLGVASPAFAAPAGPLQVWTAATAGSGAGTYQVDLSGASGSLLENAYGVNNGTSLAFAFVTPQPLSAGAYQAVGTDFQFPSALQGLQFAVAQNGAIVQQTAAAGVLDFPAVAAPAVLLVDAVAPASGAGLFDVNIQTAGSSPQLVFDRAQGVNASAPFTSQTINVGTSGSYDVTLNDLKFPAALQNLAMAVSSGGHLVGQIFGGGTFHFSAAPGAYQLSFVTIPAAHQQYGSYGVQIVNSPPVVTLTASPSSVAINATTTLTWTAANATNCTGGGGSFAGPQTIGSGTVAVAVTASTTYTLTCTGPGGSATQSVVVTAIPPANKSGGGGAVDPLLAALLCLVTLVRMGRTMIG